MLLPGSPIVVGSDSPRILGSKPYGASASDDAIGLPKKGAWHEQLTVVSAGEAGSGCTSMQLAASPHT